MKILLSARKLTEGLFLELRSDCWHLCGSLRFSRINVTQVQFLKTPLEQIVCHQVDQKQIKKTSGKMYCPPTLLSFSFVTKDEQEWKQMFTDRANKFENRVVYNMMK